MSGKYQAYPEYPEYPEYKDSGVEWLGPIPANWQVKRVKHLTQLNPSKSEVRGRSEDEHVSFIPMEAIGEQGELDASRSRPLGEVLPGYTYVADGDVMLAKITPCFENGKAAVATGLRQGIGFATTEVIPVRPNDPEDAKFFYYLLTSMPFKAVAEGSMYGSGGQKRVADSFVAEYHLAAPPSLERTQIAVFLDHETARIDRLIEKQQRLIELLKEKRQAVISHAVTKGLDPNAPMKDSGVEWLGRVPEHWVVTRAKMVSEVFVPQRNKPDINDTGDGVYWATMEDMKNDYISETNKYVSREALEAAGSKVLRRGAVVASCVGNFGVASVLNVNAVINQQLQAYIPNAISGPFLRDVIACSRVYFDLVGTAATLVYVNQEGFGNLPVPLPPFAEQLEIEKHVELSKLKFNIAIDKGAQQIRLLQERRTALISAAVTGKIDVRGWQPATQENDSEQ